MDKIKRIDLAIYISKMHLLLILYIQKEFQSKTCLNCSSEKTNDLSRREVIRDIVRVKSKDKKMSCGDCMITKQDFRISKKLKHASMRNERAWKKTH